MATPTQSQPPHVSSTSTVNDNPDPADSSPHLISTMFGALNRFIARLDAGPETQNSGTQEGYGFQVLRNTNPSVPLEPWFDFVIGINGRTIDNPDPNLFATEVRNCAGTVISLGVFSAKGQKIREIHLSVPSPEQSPDTTLGLTLQWSPLSLSHDTWHILSIAPNSPADTAGLLPYSDYVIGSPDGLIRGESGLPELVEDYLNRPLRLIVYNHEYNVTRPVTITPSRGWGGEGALGCVLGFGALHRIPETLEEPVQAPGETLFSSPPAYDEKGPEAGASPVPPPPPPPATELFVPANMALNSKSPPPPAAGAGAKKKQRAHHTVISPSAAGGLDDYFKEGEQKSLEEDYAPKSKSPVPPPPKMGGPPKGGPPRSGSGTPVQAQAQTSESPEAT